MMPVHGRSIPVCISSSPNERHGKKLNESGREHKPQRPVESARRHIAGNQKSRELSQLSPNEMRFFALETPAKLPTVATVTCVREDPVCFFNPYLTWAGRLRSQIYNVLPRGDSCDSRRIPAAFRPIFLQYIQCQLRQLPPPLRRSARNASAYEQAPVSPVSLRADG